MCIDNSEPVWAKYITEDNLPTEDLQVLCSIIGFKATKKLMLEAKGVSFKIHANCHQPYKKQYIIDNYKATKKSLNEMILKCRVSSRYVYDVMKEHIEGKKK